MSLVSLSTSILLKNPVLKKNAISLLNNQIIKNCHFYSTENDSKNNENNKEEQPLNKDISQSESSSEDTTERIDNNDTNKNTTCTPPPLQKKKNKKFTSDSFNTKYFLFTAIGVAGFIPIYYFMKKKSNLHDYNSSDVKRVKKVQKSYDSNMRQQMASYLYSLQNDLIRIIEEMDTKVTFSRSNWNQRSKNSAGGGTTCHFENGKIFEKAVVQVNVESGSLSPFQVIELLATKPSVQIVSKSLNDKFSYYKASLSSILYPQNPNVPTGFLDLAYNEVKNNSTGKIYWWFSGGNDLSDPSIYMNKMDEMTAASSAQKDSLIQEFYQSFREELDDINPEYFERFQREGKEKTYMSHRDEMRGVGGLYFNELNDQPAETLLSSVVQCFARKTFDHYKTLLEKRNRLSWTTSDKEKQAIKNSRIVEFELVSKLSSKVDDSSLKNIDKALPKLPLNVTWKRNKNEMMNDN